MEEQIKIISYSFVDEATGRVLESGRTFTVPPIPDGAVMVSGIAPPDTYRLGEAWVAIPARPGPHVVFDWSSHAWVDPRSLEELRAAKLVELSEAFEVAAQLLTEGYPASERLTWPIQQGEALAWGIDSTAPTPYLDGLALARGIEPAEMRAKTLQAVQAFMTASRQLVGLRQRLRDEALAAQTVEQIQATAWPVSAPST